MSQAHFASVLAGVSLLLPVKWLARAVYLIFNLFNFKQLVRSCIFLYLHSRINSNVGLLQSITDIGLVINRYKAATLCVFETNHIAAVNLEIRNCRCFYLSI